jgi:hypothetical protein
LPSIIYIALLTGTLAFPSEKIIMPQAGQFTERNKIMGDKSPKSTSKKSSQKSAKASKASHKKSAAVAAKSAAGKKR